MVFLFRKKKNGISLLQDDDSRRRNGDSYNVSHTYSRLLKTPRSSDSFNYHEQPSPISENVDQENNPLHRFLEVPENAGKNPKLRATTMVEQPSTKSRGRIPRLRTPPSSSTRRPRRSASQPALKNTQEAALTTPKEAGLDKTTVTPDTDLPTEDKTPSPCRRMSFGSRKSTSHSCSPSIASPGRNLFRNSSKKQPESSQEDKPPQEETPSESPDQTSAVLPQLINRKPELQTSVGAEEAHRLLKSLSSQSSVDERKGLPEADAGSLLTEDQSNELHASGTQDRQKRERQHLAQRINSESVLQSLAEQPDESLADTMFSQMPAPSPIGKVSSLSQRRTGQLSPISQAPARTSTNQTPEKLPTSILRTSSLQTKKTRLDPPEDGAEDKRPVAVISASPMKVPQLDYTAQPISIASSSKNSRSNSRAPNHRGADASEWVSDDLLSDGGVSRNRSQKTGDYNDHDAGTYDDRTYGTDRTSLRQEFRQVLDDTAQKVMDAFRCSQNMSAKQIMANPTGVMSLFYDRFCASPEYASSGVSDSLSRRPYYSEIFTREWLRKMTTVGISLLYLQAPNSPGNGLSEWKGRTVQLMIATGSTGNLLDIQPKLEWSTMAGGKSNMIMTTSMPLLKIYSILTSSSFVGENAAVCDDEIGGCFLTITSGSGDVHMFEANSVKECNDIVNGLRNLITRLSFHLITGDATASVELYRDDGSLEEGDLPSLPNPRLNMNRIAHALLDG